MELLILPMAVLRIIYSFWFCMVSLFVVGLIMVIVGVIKSISEKDDDLPIPLTREAKTHMNYVHKTRGRPKKR